MARTEPHHYMTSMLPKKGGIFVNSWLTWNSGDGAAHYCRQGDTRQEALHGYKTARSVCFTDKLELE